MISSFFFVFGIYSFWIIHSYYWFPGNSLLEVLLIQLNDACNRQKHMSWQSFSSPWSRRHDL